LEPLAAYPETKGILLVIIESLLKKHKKKDKIKFIPLQK
jgi:hypothetical protein